MGSSKLARDWSTLHERALRLTSKGYRLAVGPRVKRSGH